MRTEHHEATEARMRELLREEGLPEPDEVEYDETSIVLRWREQKLTVVIDEIPAGVAAAGDEP